MSNAPKPSVWSREYSRRQNLQLFANFSFRVGLQFGLIVLLTALNLFGLAAHHVRPMPVGSIDGLFLYFCAAMPFVYGIIDWFKLRKVAQEFLRRYPEGSWKDLSIDSEASYTWGTISRQVQGNFAVLLVFTIFTMILLQKS